MLVQNTAQMSSFLTVISNNKDIRLNKSLKNKMQYEAQCALVSWISINVCFSIIVVFFSLVSIYHYMLYCLFLCGCHGISEIGQ